VSAWSILPERVPLQKSGGWEAYGIK
jgi:hypothetical protein